MSTTETRVPLWAPDYQAGFADAIARFWKKYARFDGRASRREYWFTYLFLALGYILSLTLLYGGLGYWEATSNGDGPVPFVFPLGIALTFGWFLATIVPWLALEARRLHDANLSALFLLLHLVFQVGALVVFILCQLSPNPLGRRFDAPPGEPRRLGQVRDWPPAPGEPDLPYAYGSAGTRPTADG